MTAQRPRQAHPPARTAPAILGVVAALEREARLVRAAACACGVEARVWIACRGMGPGRAASAVGELAGRGAARVLITGYAGALDARLVPGDLLLATGACCASTGRAHACDPDLVALSAQALSGRPALHLGALATTHEMLCEPSDRADLARRCGALAVDMESASAGARAAAHGLPWIALRAVSDGADQRLPRCLGRMLDPWGRPTAAGVLRALREDPLGFARLPALARGARCADRSLASALRSLLPALAGAGNASCMLARDVQEGPARDRSVER